MANRDMQTIHRRAAASGNVSFSDAVVLHETSKTRVVLVPFFIKHSDHTELAVKVSTYGKGDGPFGWVLNEEKSLSLNEDASRKLLKALKDHLAVASAGDDGNYLLLRVSEGTADIGQHDPALVASALTKVLAQQNRGQCALSEEDGDFLGRPILAGPARRDS